ncbi:MAG TPA: hypothetical protein VGF33_04345 [Caulobacteraceae bacterium]|jgi:hypothetical protein
MATTSQIGKTWGRHPEASGGLARLGVALAWAVMGLFGAVLAAVVAATLVAVAVVGSAALAVAAVVLGARRAVRSGSSDPNLIEARHVGGHSWVASGWQGRP